MADRARIEGLAEGVVEVWTAPLADWPEASALAALLEATEQAEMQRRRRPGDALRFAAGRLLLRTLAGQYLGRPAEAVGVERGPHGQPLLRRAPGDPPLRFSVAHAGGCLVLAFALGRRVGADVEPAGRRLRPEMAARMLAPEERAALACAPEPEQARMLLQYWTRKEAYLKAIGAGIGGGLQCFATPPAPWGAAYVGEEPWAYHDLAWQGYTGAVAAEGEALAIRRRDAGPPPTGRRAPA